MSNVRVNKFAENARSSAKSPHYQFRAWLPMDVFFYSNLIIVVWYTVERSESCGRANNSVFVGVLQKTCLLTFIE